MSGSRCSERSRRELAARTAVGALAATAVLAGCSHDLIVNSGPLGGAQQPGISCGVADPARAGPGQRNVPVVTYGFEEFANTSSSPVTIERVSLADPRGLRMLAAYVVPITGTLLYGVISGYPPLPHLQPGIEWSRHQLAKGAVIPHSRGHDVTNLVLVLRPVRNPGWARAINVYYRSSSGQQYLLRQAMQVLVGIGRCPADTQKYER